MFNRQREFNIITGQQSHSLISQRSRSCTSQLQNYRKGEQLPSRYFKLGTPKDNKQFQYSYFDMPQVSMLPRIQTKPEIKKSSSVHNNSTMLNYVSTGYNIINHTNQINTARVADKVMFKEKSPLTEHIHRARMYAPNYHENYEKRTEGHEFNKKPGLCAGICEIQKTYGQSKYFRKLK